MKLKSIKLRKKQFGHGWRDRSREFFPESYSFSEQLEPDVDARTGEGTSSQPRTGLLLHGQSWLLYVTLHVHTRVCFSQKHQRHHNNNGKHRVSTAVALGFARLRRHSNTTGPKYYELLAVISLLRVEQRPGATLEPHFLTHSRFFVFVCSASASAEQSATWIVRGNK